jgi:hypothetical protein
MAAALSDDPAEVQQMQPIAGLNSFRHVPHKTLERASPAQNAHDDITRVHFRQTPGGQFEHVVGRVVGEHTHHYHVAGPRRAVFRSNLQ